MKKKFFLLISYFFILCCLYAEETVKDYSYYINLYVEKNYEIKAQQEKLNSARWNKISYLSNLLPQVSVSHTRTYDMENGLDETGWSSTLTRARFYLRVFLL